MDEYLLLIVEPVGQREARSEAEGQAAYEAMARYGAELKARGVLRAVESLTSTRDATRLAVRDGKRQLIDGPFVEAKEMIGGFFLLEGVTHAQALAIAAECPAAQWATVEVRKLGPCFA
jgi:hypothetical protein